MSKQIDNPKADSGRFAGELHSVAKQAPFRIAFRVDFESENCQQIDVISSFGVLQFASAFRAGKSLISKEPEAEKP